jgi:hypothetical protein
VLTVYTTLTSFSFAEPATQERNVKPKVAFSAISQDPDNVFEGGLASRVAKVDKMKADKIVVEDKKNVGFGTPFTKIELANAQGGGCKREDKCWLVGLSTRSSFAERVKLCTRVGCKFNDPRHSFSASFRKYVGTVPCSS